MLLGWAQLGQVQLVLKRRAAWMDSLGTVLGPICYWMSKHVHITAVRSTVTLTCDTDTTLWGRLHTYFQNDEGHH